MTWKPHRDKYYRLLFLSAFHLCGSLWYIRREAPALRGFHVKFGTRKRTEHRGNLMNRRVNSHFSYILVLARDGS